MKRYHKIISLFKRNIKESGIYYPKNKNTLKYIVSEIENTTDFNRMLVTRIAINLEEMGVSETIYKILEDYNKKNKLILSKIVYVELYKFLKKENMYNYMSQYISDHWPSIRNLRYFILCQYWPIVMPLDIFVVHFQVCSIDDLDEKYHLLDLNAKWNEHFRNFLMTEL